VSAINFKELKIFLDRVDYEIGEARKVIAHFENVMARDISMGNFSEAREMLDKIVHLIMVINAMIEEKQDKLRPLGVDLSKDIIIWMDYYELKKAQLDNFNSIYNVPQPPPPAPPAPPAPPQKPPEYARPEPPMPIPVIPLPSLPPRAGIAAYA